MESIPGIPIGSCPKCSGKLMAYIYEVVPPYDTAYTVVYCHCNKCNYSIGAEKATVSMMVSILFAHMEERERDMLSRIEALVQILHKEDATEQQNANRSL